MVMQVMKMELNIVLEDITYQIITRSQAIIKKLFTEEGLDMKRRD